MLPERAVNVLLTCAGRRNYLVRFFREALRPPGRVLAADTVESAPALAAADESFLLPPLSDPSYIDRLFDLCQRQAVRLLIPLHDQELPVVAAHTDRFVTNGIQPVVSTPEVIAICFDKWMMFEYFRQHGFAAAKTYRSLAAAHMALTRGELTFPLVIKPRHGSASAGIAIVGDEAELAMAWSLAQRRRVGTPLVQEFLAGTEYGLDIINDLDGRYVTTVVKRKLGMRAGETDRAVTERDDRLERLGAQLGHALRHVGNLDCDVLLTDTGCYAIDLNPRFGGGYPFSHAAGIRLPSALLAWVNGLSADPAWFRFEPGVMAAKYDTLTVFSAAAKVLPPPAMPATNRVVRMGAPVTAAVENGVVAGDHPGGNDAG